METMQSQVNSKSIVSGYNLTGYKSLCICTRRYSSALTGQRSSVGSVTATAPVADGGVCGGRSSQASASTLGRQGLGLEVEAGSLGVRRAEVVEGLGAHVAELALLGVRKVGAHGRLRLAELLGRVRGRVADNELGGGPGGAADGGDAALLDVVVDGVGVRLGSHAEVDVVAEGGGIGDALVEVDTGVCGPADLEAGAGLVTVAVDPEAVGLVVRVGGRVHAAGVPGGAADAAEVAHYGVLVASTFIVPSVGDPGDADGIVVGREQGVDALVLVLDVDLSQVSVVDGTRVGGDADVVAIVVPDAAEILSG